MQLLLLGLIAFLKVVSFTFQVMETLLRSAYQIPPAYDAIKAVYTSIIYQPRLIAATPKRVNFE